MAGYTEALRLLDGTTLRAVRLALQGDAQRLEPPEEPDPALISVVDRPFGSVVDAADRLSDLEIRLREQGDRRAVFLTIYSRMTGEVYEGIENGRFLDPDWMRRYVVTFANYYRRAFLAFERGHLDAVPDPWQIAFGTAMRGDALYIQDAFLGVNAHINYDLALTLTDVAIDPDRSRKYADHRAINDVLASLVDTQQRALADLYAAGVADIDDVFWRFDEAFTLLSLTESRERAWRIAVVLTDVGVAPVTAYTRLVLRATATGGASFILGPRLDPELSRKLRTVEADGITLDTVLEHVQRSISEDQ